MRVDPLIQDWLDAFASCVRNRDIQQGWQLFADDVQAFGARIERASDLDELTDNQWRPTWFNTREFRFLKETVTTLFSEDGSLVCVLALWESLGIAPGGDTFPRRGRCTILLKRDHATPHGYLAIHSHFSRTPSGEV